MQVTKVAELFDVVYGHSLELNRLRRASPAAGVTFVSRKMVDNGVSAYVEPIPGVEPAAAGNLTVALGGNGVLSTFVQERPFYTGRDVAIMTPRTPMPKPVLLYYCLCIKSNRYRYSYGRQANKSLRRLLVPTSSAVPAWVHARDVDMYQGAAASASPAPRPPLGTQLWRQYRLADLFDLSKGRRLTKADMVPGDTPFIGAVDNNNGLVTGVAQPAAHPANALTVNYNGAGVAEAFHQPVPFRCSDDVNVLHPKFPMDAATALFIAAVIRREKYRFSYGRKWHLERMRESTIRLPAAADGSPDWTFMRRYILSTPFSSRIE